MSEVAGLIKSSRKKLKLTQAQFSDQLGYTAQFVHHWEKGRAPVPLAKIKDVCQVLSIDLTTMKKALLKDYENLLKKYL